MMAARMAKSGIDTLGKFRSSRAYRAGTLLKALHLGLTDHVETRLQAAGVQLTRPQALALMTLVEHPGISNADLARLNGIAPQTMHQIMGRLEREGLAARAPHPILRRVQAFEATARGLELVTRGSHVARAAIEDALQGLRAGEQEALIDLLQRCVDGLARRRQG
ncbi:MarR family transcriptional regulator [Luteimonas yindakuii]|nr:MarR family transcriptional regulator [Luteimonas yindakuii]